MVGWHLRLDGREFEQAPGNSEGQESLACCSPRGHRESDTAQRLNDNNRNLCRFSKTIHFKCLMTSCPWMKAK